MPSESACRTGHVFVNATGFIHLADLAGHKEKQLLVIALDRLELELAALINLIAFENIVIEENATDRIFLALVLSVISESFQKDVDRSQTLLPVDDEICLDFVLFANFS